MRLIKKKIFLIVHNYQGFNHWIFQRISALCFLTSLFLVYFTNSIIFGILGVFVIIIHINSGLETLLVDYLHDSVAKKHTETILDIVIICLVKFSVLLFFHIIYVY
jgi:succinate dehydrogenase hydrophobic anchor subunit